MIDLSAADYINNIWDNKATTGTPSVTNGDFGVINYGGTSDIPPVRATFNNLTSVYFSYSPGTNPSLSTFTTPTGTNANMFNQLYGSGTWSFESLIMQISPTPTSPATEDNTESPYFQWGARGAATCTSGFMSLGHNPIWGAGGFFNCDIYYSPGPNTVQVLTDATTGFRPIPNIWHHIVMTYTGTAADSMISIYLDGQLSTAVPRTLNILRVNHMHIGSWFNTGAPPAPNPAAYMTASCAINMFRAHTGVLSAADVAFNFAQLQATLLSVGSAGYVPPPASGPGVLATSGYQRVLLSCLGCGLPGADLPFTVTYSGANPANPSQLLTYPAGVDQANSNSSAIIITTAPGVGVNLTFTVSVAGGPVGSGIAPTTGTSGPIASYATPSVSTWAAVSGFANGTASSNGGDRFMVTGASFGPITLPGVANYTPTVIYGLPTARFIAANCVRRNDVTHETSITCQTVPGAGQGWQVSVCAGPSGPCSPPAGPLLNYPPPVMTGLSGTLSMSTAGGERIVATGTGFGSPASMGLYPVVVQWSPAALAAAGVWLYSGAACGLESISNGNAVVQVGCNTVPGMGGKGFSARVVIGNTASARYTPAAFGFAAPVIQTVSGPGAVNAATIGGQGVNITGLNFGNGSAPLNVSYMLSLQSAVPGVTRINPDGSFSPNTVVYNPTGCFVSVPHTQLTCTTTPGSGAALSWSVVVNGVMNAYPTSAYASPVVSSFALMNGGTYVTAQGADAAGGTTLVVTGSGFGPTAIDPVSGAMPLLQLVSLVSPSGQRVAMPNTSVALVSDSQLTVTLPPGSAAGWYVVVRVADHESQQPPATFSYALPAVTAVTCGGGAPTGATTGGATCVVAGTNFPLDDPFANIMVFFGNPSDGSLFGSAIPALVQAPFITFVIPPGAGGARAVRVVSYRNGDSIPNPGSFFPPPAAAAPACASLTGCTGTFTYAAPAIAAVISQATAIPGFSRSLTIQGANFGTTALSALSGTAGSMLFDIEYSTGGPAGPWIPTSGLFSPTSPTPQWSDLQITVLTTLNSTTIRVAITSLTWAGTPVKQVSNAFTYVDLNPIVTLAANTPSFPTSGYTASSPLLLSFTVQYLSAVNSLSVTVGGAACPLVTGANMLSTNAMTDIVNNPAAYSPAGPITPSTVWSVQCRVPAGQGANVPVIVTRWPDGVQSAANTTGGAGGATAWTLNYAAPQVTYVQGAIYNPAVRTFVAADGGTPVQLQGSNFGPCPVILFAGVYIPYGCGGACDCSSAPPGSAAAGASMTLSTDVSGITTLTFVAPSFAGVPGSSTGVVPGVNVSGYTMSLWAGGQMSISGMLPVGWAPPTITSVSTLTAGVTTTYTLSGAGNLVQGRVMVRADGATLVSVTGTSFGACPVINFAYANFSQCGVAACTPCADPSYSLTLTVSGVSNTATLSFVAPPGAGTGALVGATGFTAIGVGPSGWTMTVGDGRQQNSAPVPVGWTPPVVTGVTSSLITPTGNSSFPTRGGVTVTVLGSQFGTPFPASFALPSIPAMALRVYFGRGPFVDPAATAPAPAPNCTTSGNVTVCVTPTPAPGPSASTSWAPCGSVVQLDDRTLQCSLPEGSGAGLFITVVSAGSAGTSASPLLTYDRPIVSSLSSSYGGVPSGVWPCNASAAPPVVGIAATGNASVQLSGPTTGCFVTTITGTNFGPDRRAVSGATCVFVASRARDPADALFVCDGMESFAGEGEVYNSGARPDSWLLSWSHESISFVMPKGVGDADVMVFTDGQTQANLAASPSFSYYVPTLNATLLPALGTTSGGTNVTLTGANFGVGESNATYPLPLPLSLSFAPLLHVFRVNWGPSLRPISSFNAQGPCVSSSTDEFGMPPVGAVQCAYTGAVNVTQNAVSLLTPPGVGAGLPVTISIIDLIPPGAPQPPGQLVVTSPPAAPAVWSYNPPRISAFADNTTGTTYVMLGGAASPTVRMTGFDFGSPALVSLFGNPGGTSTWATVTIDGRRNFVVGAATPVVLASGGLFTDATGAGAMQFQLLPSTPVGVHDVSVTIGGQTGTLSSSAPSALLVGCSVNYYGLPGESCLPCPLGGMCDGYNPLTNTHTYPYAAAGFYSLNSTSDGSAAACPADKTVAGRTGVCIVACFNAAACLGANQCAPGYISTAPVFRCNSCAQGFYSLNTQCTPCPTGGGPYALVICYCLLVLAAGALAYVMSKNAIRIGYLSIGLDYAQVVAMFATANTSWTTSVKQLFLVLSAFNLNVEIVAPECIAPLGSVTWTAKFTTVMLLPIFIAVSFLTLHAGLTFYKGVVLGRSKNLTRHAAPLIASVLLSMYVLYIYLCKMTFDVFDCQPSPTPPAYSGTAYTDAVTTLPPDRVGADPFTGLGGRSILYLQADKTPCQFVQGSHASLPGTQTNVIGVAIASLIVYVVGYPVALGLLLWKKRELIIEDQLLRAKGTGDDRLTNPNAYALRRSLSSVYYQWKPSVYWWTTMILLRKFFIAFISLEFAQDASFQLGACLLVLLAAYSAQVGVNPYMPPSEFEDVLKAHEAAAFSDPLHARLRFKLQQIETRGRKRTRTNQVMSHSGKVNAKALLGVVTGWLWNHNSVEQLLLLSAIVIALMGIMFNASGVSGGDAYGSSDAWKATIGGIVLAIVIITILYFVAVVVVDVWTLWREAASRAALARTRGSGKKLAGDAAKRAAGSARGGAPLNLGPVDTAINPLFVSMSGGGGGGGDLTSNKALSDALSASNQPPPPELWATFRTSFQTLLAQVDQLNAQLTASKQAEARADSEGEPGGSVAPSSVRRAGGGPPKRTYGPMGVVEPGGPATAAGTTVGSPGHRMPNNPAVSLSQFRSSGMSSSRM